MTHTLIQTRPVTTMTKARALEIQAEQIAWYGRTYGIDRVRALVAAVDTSHVLADVEHDIVTINRHIPRGGDLEWLIPEIREREQARMARERAEWEAEKAARRASARRASGVYWSHGGMR